MTEGWTLPTGGSAFPFDNPGDWVKITVEEFEPNLPQTDPKTGEPKRYQSGAQAYMSRIGGTVIESSNPGVAAGGEANLYMKGSLKPTNVRQDGTAEGSTNAAITAAIKAATGGNQLMPKSTLTVQYVADEPDTPRGMSPTKRYAAWYEAPAARPLGAVGPARAPSTPAAAPVGGPGPSAPSAGPAAAPAPTVAPTAAANGLTPEQEAEAALAAYMATQTITGADLWDADPRVAPLRAKGLADEVIRTILKI